VGIVYYENILFYLIDNYFPWTYPEFLFELVDKEIPQGWFLSSRPKDPSIKLVLGYKEFCFDKKYYEDLFEREKYAEEIYYKRKREMYPDYDHN
jgi:hypothetical protein